MLHKAMRYRFGPFLLDGDQFELRRDGESVAVEPQVLSLLLALVERSDRLVTRDELIDLVWHGRIVSEAAISSRIKSARQAIGDDGTRQALIRTIHGRGFRFVAEVALAPPSAVPRPAPPEEAGAAGERPSIAVLPLDLLGDPGRLGFIAEALPHELIAQLSRLRWLKVIARGSSFRIRGAASDPLNVGKLLGVGYSLSGTLEIEGGGIAISAELADTASGAILWAERYTAPAEAVHDIRGRIVAEIMAALEIRIPLNEAQQARLDVPERLDAWSAYHLGLQHMFRFSAGPNEAATLMFEHALSKSPDFARAHAGLSFTRFQNAFLRYRGEPAAEAKLARAHAERAVECDPLDPFVNLAMGRALWLEGGLEDSLAWLARSTELSPNYAQAIYATAWTETLLGQGEAGQADADRSMQLSPIDPLHYAMLATRALSHLVRGDDEQAIVWSGRAARAPGAHVLIDVIAAACHALGGDEEGAAMWAGRARQRDVRLGREDFFRSFPFQDARVKARIAEGLKRQGF
ncbi:MAG: transcriptional regulator domain protein [Alphaproteobacteria bacterium]|nr:transcriptional regulator domain protein [Alphaproteobacteria bacterium]